MSVNLATGYTRTTAEPVDVLYLTNTLTSYASTSAANTAIVSSVRYIGQFVNINNQLYWYKNGITDGDLILFNQETTPLTTKGDIYVRNASADTRLPIGTDTQILIADSTTATGLKWGNNISLTTTGSSGAATLISNVLNIPTYTLAGLGGQPLATNLTSLSALSYSSASFVKMTAAGTFSLDTTSYYPSSNPSGYTSNAGTVTSVGGTGTVSGLTLTGTVTTTGNLTLGGTLSVTPSNFASQTANTFLAAPNGSAGIPAFRTIVAADIPTLNQNTTGSAGSVTNNFIIKADSGTTEGTDLYTFNGSVAKTLNILAGSNVTITKAAGSWTIAATQPTVNNGTLTLAVSGVGLSGSATFTANQSTGSTFTVTSNATSTNTVSTIVSRDASGNFSAGTITATSFVKSGGTSSQLLAADGSVVTAGTGITISGGTINASVSGGTVTTVSVVSANGFAGTVATPSSTPAITLSTTITGLLKGNGTAISAASAGTDYQAPISLTVTGNSGPATFISNTLNIPTYTLTGLGGFTNPMTTLGDVIYGGASGVATRLLGNTTTTKKFLIQTGTGTVSAAPVWDTILASDIPGSALTKTDDTNVTLTLGGSASTALLNAASITVGWTGTLAVGRGGTGASTLTGVVIGNASSAMTAVSSVTANQLFRVNATGTGYEFFTPSYITSAITSLGGLTGATQTFADDTNVTMVSTGTTHTITWSGTLANSRLATMANNTIKGNVSGSTASPSDLTGTQVTAILDLFSTTTTTKGLVPGSNNVGATYFLNANGAWAIPGIKTGIASGTDTYNSTISGVSAYNDSDSYIIKFLNTSTGASTLNINTLGNIPIKLNDRQDPVQSGDIQQNSEYLLIYNSDNNYFKIFGSGNFLRVKDTGGYGGLNKTATSPRIGTNNNSADKTLTITVYDEDAIKITTDVSQGPTSINIAPGYTAGNTITTFTYNGEQFLSISGTATGFFPNCTFYGSDGVSNNSNLSINGAIQLQSDISVDFYTPLLKYTNGSNYIGFQLPTLSTDSTYTLPASVPTSNKVLQSDSSGVLTWVTNTGGGGLSASDAIAYAISLG